MPFRNLAILFVASLVCVICYHKARTSRYASEISQAIAITEENYIKEVSGRTLFENAMDGMLKDLDPYSGFIRPEPMKRFNEIMQQEKIGIGVMIDPEAREDRLVILSPLPGSPADRAGVLPGDEIVSVDGVTLESMGGVDEAFKALRGPEGSQVTIGVVRALAGKAKGGEGKDEEGAEDKDAEPEKPPEPIELTMQRYAFTLESVTGDWRKPTGGWSFRLKDFPRIGYIRIDNFGEKTSEELRDALATYKKEPVDALLLDLRDNPGGLLSPAVEICDAFINGGRIVTTRGRDHEIKSSYDAAPGTLFPIDVPMVVLVNGNSASAAEIVSACLQDHGRAIVVGERSFGKGTVQNVIHMEGGRSALKLTTASYWRPSERNIHRFPDDDEEKEWGVRPDPGMTVETEPEDLIDRFRWRRRRDVVELVPDRAPPETESGAAADESIEANDPQLARAIEAALEQIKKNLEAIKAA